MQDSITRVYTAPAADGYQRRRQQKRPSRAFILPTEGGEELETSQPELTLQPVPRRSLGDRAGSKPLAEEAGQILDVRA